MNAYFMPLPVTLHESPRCLFFWYDRSLRLWTIIEKDAAGNQIGGAEYAPNRAVLNVLLRMRHDEAAAGPLPIEKEAS